MTQTLSHIAGHIEEREKGHTEDIGVMVEDGLEVRRIEGACVHSLRGP